jgi:hypothetical protein
MIIAEKYKTNSEKGIFRISSKALSKRQKLYKTQRY